MFPASKAVQIDPDLWRACAGSNVNIPEVGAKVYYFPEGHAEQCDSTPLPLALRRNIFRCRVLHVRHFIDQTTDELSAAILLQQAGSDFRAPPRLQVDGREGSRIESFMKILTQSDANNGGGFSVPRQCAESIFPPLNYQDDPPVQNLSISDVQGRDWVFRHIYRGKPKRHLLTTGWSKFVNHKRLIGGDTIVFMRDGLTRKMYTGIRRLRNEKKGTYRRSLLSPRLVEEAALRAARGIPFEVVIYPTNCMSDFVVSADLVDRALNFRWAIGMRVKMDVAADDPSRRSCLQGHVSFVKDPHECASLWKIIQVTWDEPEHMQNVEMLNPWQVECVDHHFAPLQCINPPNKLLVPRTFHLLTPGIREPRSLMGQRGLLFGLSNQSMFTLNAHLSRMQGARHLSLVSGINGGDTRQMLSHEDTLQRGNMPMLTSRVAEVHPPQSHSNMHSFGDGNGIPHSIVAQDGNNSIQLFGKYICVKNPAESQPIDDGCLETYASRVGGNKAEDKAGMELKTGPTRIKPVEGN